MSTVFEVISTLEQLPVTTEVLEVNFLILYYVIYLLLDPYSSIEWISRRIWDEQGGETLGRYA